MVKINKIYTRTGDDGTTGLGTGTRVPKDDLRVEAYGAVDEANATVGMAINACDADNQPHLAALLRSIQHDLFDVGADLCVPGLDTQSLRATPEQVQRLELIIDELNENIEPLESFILPGGANAAATLHLARTITRLAERRAVALLRTEPECTNPQAVRYLNRLSDLLFVMARVANDNGRKDVLWIPGKNRNFSDDNTKPDPQP
jgi:cob(I)alamin adenosyltransferase